MDFIAESYGSQMNRKAKRMRNSVRAVLSVSDGLDDADIFQQWLRNIRAIPCHVMIRVNRWKQRTDYTSGMRQRTRPFTAEREPQAFRHNGHQIGLQFHALQDSRSKTS